MPLSYFNGQAIFFAHVPKTGGSSVEDYLAERFGSLSLIDINKRTGVSGTGLITPATHLSANDLREFLPQNLAYSFAVVRDPLTRIMSEYRYQSGVSRMSRFSFSKWLCIMLSAARLEPRIYDNHIRPQSDLAPEAAEIFKLEDGFDDMIARLDSVTGTSSDLKVPHLNTRKKQSIDLKRNDIELIRDFYAVDYERFDYSPPIAEQYPNDGGTSITHFFAPIIARALVAKQHRDWVK